MISYIFFFLLLAGAIWCLFQISRADWRRRIIPDVYLFPLMLIGFLVVTWFPWPITTQDAAIGAIFGYALAFLTGLVYSALQKNPNNTPIGMGDMKLMATGGIWLGTTGLAIALVITCLMGYAWGTIKKQKFIPFAPFFAFASILSFIITILLI